MKKSSIKYLVFVFVALIAVYLIIEYFQSKTKRGTFKRELFKIDTSAVTKVMIKRAKDTAIVELLKNNNRWQVKIKENKFASVPERRVEMAINELIKISTHSLASNNKDKWGEFQVADTNGMNLTVFEGEKKTVDMMIGKIVPISQRSFYTCIRNVEEKEVYYTTGGFLPMYFSTDLSMWRNQNIISANKDSLVQLTFSYPADSSFTLRQDSNIWHIGADITDSANTHKYLDQLRYLNDSHFADYMDTKDLEYPVMTLTITEKGKEPVQIKAYLYPYTASERQWIINSSANPDSYFNNEGKLFEKIFVPKANFFAESGKK